MNSTVLFELAHTLQKLYTLEESIIYAENMNAHDLRSKQALLVSEVIQSLQSLEDHLKKESIPTLADRSRKVMQA